jgi:catechol 2,3-dioxygenase-like lactoylglutathione lyase family enzyme
MMRLHVNLAVTDLDASVRFYSSLFDAAPTVLESDYAKWMLDDPLVNFALSTHGSRKGVDHLGVQVESPDELSELHARLGSTGGMMIEQGETTCCYAHSEKNWVVDPEGIAWETFLTTGDSPVYGLDDARISGGGSAVSRRDTTCCAAQAHPGDGHSATSCC